MAHNVLYTHAMHASNLLPTILLFALGLATTACDSVPDASSCDGDKCDEHVNTLNQWSPELRDAFRFTSQGARLVPYKWLLALEQANSTEAYADPQNLKRLGFNTAPTSKGAKLPQKTESGLVRGAMDLNPDRLPIGLVKDQKSGIGSQFDEEWAGLTCAACHTSTVNFGGKEFLVDGGAALLDVQSMENELLASVERTIFDGKKFERFAKIVGGDKEILENNLKQFRKDLSGRISRNATELRAGPGRVDAFAALVNAGVCKVLPLTENCRNADAPSTYPSVWGIGDLDWVQANSLSHGTLSRNVGEVLGVYAHTAIECPHPITGEMVALNTETVNAVTGELLDDEGNVLVDKDGKDLSKVSLDQCKIKSSIDIENLVLLEQWLKELDAPKWEETPLPPIDWKLAAVGEGLYRTTGNDGCVDCHSLPDATGQYEINDKIVNPQRKFVATVNVPLCVPNEDNTALVTAATKEPCPDGGIGTDPGLVLGFLTRTSKTGMFAPLLGGKEVVHAAGILKIVQTMIIKPALEAMTPEQRAEATDYRGDEGAQKSLLQGYKARQLAGIAFSAPYLHNNAIPNMDLLLTEPDKRGGNFYIGSTEYDPVNMGYVSTASSDPKVMEYDVSLSGNRNTGHAYGPASATYEGERASDRKAIIEYLKTLSATPRSPTNY